MFLKPSSKIGLSKDLPLLDHGNDNFQIDNPDGTSKEISLTHCFHSAGRATSIVIWDTKRFVRWLNLMKCISKRFENNLKSAGDWHTAITNLVEERVDRYKRGEKLNDLLAPTWEARMGTSPTSVVKIALLVSRTCPWVQYSPAARDSSGSSSQ